MEEAIVRDKYERITKLLINNQITITTMESMTAGLIASLLTDTEGASAIFKGGFVTYSNDAKIAQGVPASVIDTYGVYSLETAGAMAKACCKSYRADIGIGLTGTSGNVDIHNDDSVPGKVFAAIYYKGKMYETSFVMDRQVSRYEYKLFAADRVANSVLKIIELS